MHGTSDGLLEFVGLIGATGETGTNGFTGFTGRALMSHMSPHS